MKKSVISGIVEMFGNEVYVWSAKLIAMCTIIAFVSEGHGLTSQKVFKLIAWLEVVRYSFFYAVQRSIIYLSQAYFSAQRIEVSEGLQYVNLNEVCAYSIGYSCPG